MSLTSADTNRPARRETRGEVQAYDFVRPACLSKEQVRTLQLVHESFAHRLSGVLSPALRLVARVTAAPVREMTYADFLESLPEHVVTAVFRLSSHSGSALFASGCDNALFMLDRLLGGATTSLPEPRWLTEIECTLMEGVIGKIVGAYAETWAALAEVTPNVRQVTSTAMFSHVALPSDVVCRAEFSVEVGAATGAFSLCLPVIPFEPLLSGLVLQHWLAASRGQSDAGDEPTGENVSQVRVPVQAVLGCARVTLSRIAQLTVGEVIRLDTHVDDDTEILIGGRTKFFGRPGRTDGRLAVQITREAASGEGIR